MKLCVFFFCMPWNIGIFFSHKMFFFCFFANEIEKGISLFFFWLFFFWTFFFRINMGLLEVKVLKKVLI